MNPLLGVGFELLSPTHLLILLVLGLLFFGKRLPEIGRSLGKSPGSSRRRGRRSAWRQRLRSLRRSRPTSRRLQQANHQTAEALGLHPRERGPGRLCLSLGG